MELQFDRTTFNADITSKLDEIKLNYLTPESPDDEAFTYAAVSLIDGEDVLKDEYSFFYTDGKNDKGIDACTIIDGNFTIYQCKSAESLNTETSNSYGADTVNQLEEAIKFLLSDEPLTCNERVQKIFEEFHQNIEHPKLTAILAVEGTLTPQAQERLEQIRGEFDETSVTISVLDEVAIYNNWHLSDSTIDLDKIKISLTIDSLNSVILQNGWCCAVLNIGPLIDAMDEYDARLFDLNVRSTLKGSKINKKIKDTLSTAKGQKRFVHLNNGIVITCNNYDKPTEKNLKITVHGAQVVNGCQTLNSIRELYRSKGDAFKAELRENVKIIAKIINKPTADKDGLLDEIIVASNDQNPMNPRNLKSNSFEQKELQRIFYASPLKSNLRYFYIRKDGEIDSFIASKKVREPRKSYFEIVNTTKKAKNKLRHLDNLELAKVWWSWIGNGPKVNNGSVNFFEDPVYSQIFLHRPTSEFWHEVSKSNYEFNKSLLEDGNPSQYQFLLAMAVSRFLSEKIKPDGGNTNALKRNTIEKLKEDGKLADNSSQADIGQALTADTIYLQNLWRSQMTFAVTEIAAFLLCNKYDRLDSDICQKLIDLPDVSHWLENGMDPDRINDAQIENPDKPLLLNPIAELIIKSLDSFFLTNKNAILSENRPKLFLSNRDSLKQIKTQCLQTNEDWRYQPTKFKNLEKSYLEMLPEL